MGSVRVHARKRTLFLDFRFDGQRCREYTALPETATNRKTLERLLVKVEAEIEAGTFDYEATFGKRPPAVQPKAPVPGGAASQPTEATPIVAAFSAQWLATRQIEWRRSHAEILERTIAAHIVPKWGERPIGSITKAEILAWRTELASREGRTNGRLGNRRINGILAPLRQMLGDAADQFGFVSPMQSLKPLKLRKTDVEPFSLDEVQAILTRVRLDWRNYFAVRFFTGMRTGEVHGLKWKYVDFERRLILVRETIVNGEDEYTKTDSSQRDLQMNQVVHDALRRQQTATGKLGEYVFCTRSGQPLDNKNFVNRVWKPLLRHLGLKDRRPYQMRHTAATLWLASGEAPEWIARQLGHASTEMLFRVYSRYVPNLTRRDGSAIDRLLATRFATGDAASTQPIASDGSGPSGSAFQALTDRLISNVD